MSDLVPTEALGENALFELLQQGEQLGTHITVLESLADTRSRLAISQLREYTDIPGVTEADYPQLVDLSVSANFFAAKALNERARLSELMETTRSQFVGRTALITPRKSSPTAITAFWQSSSPFLDNRELREQSSILTKAHPNRARGTIQDIVLTHAQLVVRPRLFSPYRPDRGRFRVEAFDDQGNPAIKVEFADAA